MTFPVGGYTDAASAQTDGVTQCWKINETSGTTIANEITSVNLTTQNDATDATIENGLLGKCRNYGNVANSYSNYTTGTNTTYSGSWGLSFWYKPTSTPPSNVDILTWGSGGSERCVITLNTDLTFTCSTNTQSNTSSSSLSLNSWNHISISSEENRGIKLYLNNSLVANGTDEAIYVDDVSLAVFGNSSSTTNGAIDDVAIWGRTLDSSEISDIYNSGSGTQIIQDNQNDKYIYHTINTASTLSSVFTGGNLTSENIHFDDSTEYLLAILRALSDAIHISSQGDWGDYIKVLKERLHFSDVFSIHGTSNLVLSENVTLEDVLLLAYYIILQDAIDVNDNSYNIKQFLKELVEQFLLTSSITSNHTANLLLLDDVLFSDLLERYFEYLLNEGININKTLINNYKASLSISENIHNSETTSLKLNIALLSSEDVDVASSISSLGILQSLIDENILVSTIKIQLGDDIYTGWVMNPETFAVWNYDGWNFNSMAKWKNEYYGCKEDGIYLLDGVDDDGTYIQSSILTAALDFGTSNLKQIPTVYLGASTDGTLIFKIKTDNNPEIWYEVQPSEDNLYTQKIPFGKGIIGRYWQFELISKDNKEFNLSDIEFYPIVFKRKI